MEVEITPEPGEDERRAILAALADDGGDVPNCAWPRSLLPDRGEDPDLP